MWFYLRESSSPRKAGATSTTKDPGVIGEHLATHNQEHGDGRTLRICQAELHAWLERKIYKQLFALTLETTIGLVGAGALRWIDCTQPKKIVAKPTEIDTLM